MKFKELVPKPRSSFLKVKCKNCGNIQIVFSHVSRPVQCNVCNELLARPTGGKAEIEGEIIEQVG
jgi:small subunit ribosomal protein S27e